MRPLPDIEVARQRANAPGPGHEGYLMPTPEDIARSETRTFLVSLRDALGQPPLPVVMRLCVEGVMDLLGEPDLDKRLAARDRLDAMVAELDGRADL